MFTNRTINSMAHATNRENQPWKFPSGSFFIFTFFIFMIQMYNVFLIIPNLLTNNTNNL